jgi:CBS-domain-containing membrane protein
MDRADCTVHATPSARDPAPAGASAAPKTATLGRRPVATCKAGCGRTRLTATARALPAADPDHRPEEPMNVAFFLTPKSEVAWLPARSTMREALDAMDRSGYTAVPLLDDEGRYVGVLSEGDLLRAMTREPNVGLDELELFRLDAVPRRADIRAVGIDSETTTLFSRALAQSFVPVVDSRGVFIGIVRRRTILEHCVGLLPASP